mgnify:CR=1 FL=1
MLNKIIVMGRLTRDPELRRTQSGLSVTSFSVACDRDFKSQSGEKETDFIDIVAWRTTAEFVCKYFSKGRMAVVEGRLQIRDWQDNNGNKRRSAEIVATMFTLGVPNATVTEAAISRAVTRRRADILSRARATVRRAALVAALLLVDILPLTTVTLVKSARMMESCHSETVARATGRQPPKEVNTMASYRNISMDFWTDSKVVDDFTPEDRYIYLYCMTNPHTNLCGCYEVSIKQIANETGYNNDSVERLLKRLDSAHNVIRYSAQTKELLILNWCRYNWSTSEKLNKPLLGEIRKVKNDRFREYLAARYNERSTVTAQYNAAEDGHPEVPRHKHGAHGWVRLTEEEYARLIDDLGEEELTRCIDYIDESAQMHGNKNKWRDWNLVIRKCSRERWGIRAGNGSRPSASGSAMDDLQQLHQMYASEESL